MLVSEKFPKIVFRPFYNSDLTQIVRLWNEENESVSMRQKVDWLMFNRIVLSKPYFMRNFLWVAVDTSENVGFPYDGKIVGFAHGGFSPNENLDGVDMSCGCVAMLVVEKHQDVEFRNEIADVLLWNLEEEFRKHGARTITVGAVYPDAPFYQGMYVGGVSAGIHEMDSFTSALMRRNEYLIHKRYVIYYVDLQKYHFLFSRERKQIRGSYEVHTVRYPLPETWWEASAMSILDYRRYELHSSQGRKRCAKVFVGKMAIRGMDETRKMLGMYYVQVEKEYRHQGLGFYLVSYLLELLQQQAKYQFVKSVVPKDNDFACKLFDKLASVQKEQSMVYQKNLESVS
ncbi:MAG: GNAT family N-acetyltransferase [Planctomycetia bacterium]|nr:GNAT family N-acetyltransferase [Planctomycetia bacterium]